MPVSDPSKLSLRFVCDGPGASFSLQATAMRRTTPPIVFLHGVMRRWQTFLPLFAGLGPRWPLCGLDFPGHGESDRWPGHYRVADYVTATVDHLRRSCHEPVILYGHSLGAMVAAGVAAALPSLVRAVVLEDPPFSTMGPSIERTAWHGYFAALHRLVCEGAFSSAGPTEKAKRLADLEVPDPASRKLRRLGELRNASAIRFLAACLHRMDPEVLSPIVAAKWLDGYDWQEAAKQIAAPVLLIQADPAAGGMLVDSEARAFGALVRDATLVTLGGAGHNLHVDRTQDVLNLTTQFLSCLEES
jgi:pimeloyl-ACP methyl ester carboxylesterase